MHKSGAPNFGEALATGRALDLKLPDTTAVSDAYAQAHAESQPWLFNHVVRSWLYGAKLAQNRALKPDDEVLAVAVLLHDLGLARGGASDRRFEVVGADAGRAFAFEHDMGERRAETIWDAIALHTTSSIAQFKGVDVACTTLGIGCDFGGFSYHELSDADKDVILSAYPRLRMKEELTVCLAGICKNHPHTTRDNFVADFGVKFVPGYTRPSPVDLLYQHPSLNSGALEHYQHIDIATRCILRGSGETSGAKSEEPRYCWVDSIRWHFAEPNFRSWHESVLAP